MAVADMYVWGNSFFDYSCKDKHKYDTFSIEEFINLLDYISDDSILVIAGINASKENKRTWKLICVDPSVTVALDLYSIGIVFFNSNLHRKTYKSFVL